MKRPITARAIDACLKFFLVTCLCAVAFSLANAQIKPYIPASGSVDLSNPRLVKKSVKARLKQLKKEQRLQKKADARIRQKVAKQLSQSEYLKTNSPLVNDLKDTVAAVRSIYKADSSCFAIDTTAVRQMVLGAVNSTEYGQKLNTFTDSLRRIRNDSLLMASLDQEVQQELEDYLEKEQMSPAAGQVPSANQLVDASEFAGFNQSLMTQNVIKIENPTGLLQDGGEPPMGLKQRAGHTGKFLGRLKNQKKLKDVLKQFFDQESEQVAGEPFLNRLQFGGLLQYKVLEDSIELAFSPQVSYDITGKVRLGLGIEKAIDVGTKNFFLRPGSHFNYRSFADYIVIPSAYLHLELESFPRQSAAGEKFPASRDYLWSVGAGKDFNLKGHGSFTVLLLGHINDRHDQYPRTITIKTGYKWQKK